MRNVAAILFLFFSYAFCNIIVYTEGLVNGWSDYSWNSNRGFANTQYSHTGSYSASFSPTVQWAGFYLHQDTPFQIPQDWTLIFWTNGGSATQTGWYRIYLYSDNNQIGSTVPLPNAINPNQWTNQSIPVSAFDVGSAMINGIAIQFTNTNPSTLYIDDYQFVSPQTSATTKAPTAKPTTRKPTTKKPTTQKPTTATPTTITPSTAVPSTSGPTTTIVTTVKPATTKPTTKKPTTKKPTTRAPTTAQPTTRLPTTQITTTTSTPTTQKPTTSVPTTKKQTNAPTTQRPTTSSPTTPSGPVDSTVNSWFTTRSSGDGTYYGQNTGGTCTLSSGASLPSTGTNNITNTVAMNSVQWTGSELCGACLQVTGSGQGSGSTPIVGTFNVFVTNLCPECQFGSLDLALSGDGRWGISWIVVPCTPTGNLQYMFVGSNSYYIKLQIRNYKYPVYKVAVSTTTTYKDLVRTSDNYWEDSNEVLTKPISMPLKIRITSVNGIEVFDSISSIDSSLHQGTTQF